MRASSVAVRAEPLPEVTAEPNRIAIHLPLSPRERTALIRILGSSDADTPRGSRAPALDRYLAAVLDGADAQVVSAAARALIAAWAKARTEEIRVVPAFPLVFEDPRSSVVVVRAEVPATPKRADPVLVELLELEPTGITEPFDPIRF